MTKEDDDRLWKLLSRCWTLLIINMIMATILACWAESAYSRSCITSCDNQGWCYTTCD